MSEISDRLDAWAVCGELNAVVKSRDAELANLKAENARLREAGRLAFVNGWARRGGASHGGELDVSAAYDEWLKVRDAKPDFSETMQADMVRK